MTLQSVAEKWRKLHPESVSTAKGHMEAIVGSFEADPEFTAPERLKEAERQLAEAREALRIVIRLFDQVTAKDRARLKKALEARRALGEKP